jgi:hypothetical protein
MMTARWAVEGTRSALGTNKIPALLALVVDATDFTKVCPLMVSSAGAIERTRRFWALKQGFALVAHVVFHGLISLRT